MFNIRIYGEKFWNSARVLFVNDLLWSIVHADPDIRYNKYPKADLIRVNAIVAQMRPLGFLIYY